MNKQELKQRFERLFKGCTLYAIHLDGFSHTIFYKDKEGKRHIGVYSGYASSCECDKEEKLYEDNVYRSYSTDILKVMFLGIPNYAYQCNAQEIIYEDHCKW